MPENKIGKIPDFTADEPTSAGKEGIEEVKQPAVEETVAAEKETPPELPAEEKTAGTEEVPGPDATELQRQYEGLLKEKEKLLDEIESLRGTRREIKQEEAVVVQKKIDQTMDDLKDLYPNDIETVDRILRAKGYVTKDEATKMFYDNVKNQELEKFLNENPQYKPDNDPNDLNWNALQRELRYYKMPENPHEVYTVLQKAHRTLQAQSRSVPSDQTVAAKKRQAEVAGVGAKAATRSSSIKSLDPTKRQALRDGGWSEEEIRKIEESLPE